MAEQKLAEKAENFAATIADGGDEPSINGSNQPASIQVERNDVPESTEDLEPSATDASGTESTFIMVKEPRSISRARSLRLQAQDLIVAVDGVLFQKDIETFLDMMFECDPDNGKVLTLWRNGVLFNIVARGPLGCVLEHAKADVSEKAREDFKDFSVDSIKTYTTFEVLRDIHRNCIVIDTRFSPMAMIFPPLWLIQNRLWEVLVAVFLIYGSTLAVHWVLFLISYVVLGVYFRKAHLVLRRSFAMMRGRHIWLVLAERSEKEIQLLCRRMDPKSVFVPDLIGPPLLDEPKKKKRRRRGQLS